MTIRGPLRIPGDPVLRKIIFLVVLVIATAGILVGESHLGQMWISRCGERYDNQHARRSLGRYMRLTLAKLESAVRQLAAEDDARSAALARGEIPEMIGHLEDALSILSNGGVHEHVVRLNLEHTDAFHETVSYSKTKDNRIVIEVIELAPKLADLEANVARLADAVERRIAAKVDHSHEALGDAVTLCRKQAEATLLRAGENANKIYYDTSKQLVAIERENEQIVSRMRLVENATAGVLVLVCLIVGGVTLRGVVRILNERGIALSELQKHHDHLDELVNERTTALSKTNEQLQQEVTERKRAEVEVRESEERLKALLDANPTGIVVIDTETHEIVEANPVAIGMIGASREQVLGRKYHKYICPAESGQCPITDLGQEVDNAERMLVRADGEEVPILKTVVTIVLDGRECLLESFIDISKHKEAEENLRESEERHRAITESAQDAIITADAEGNIRFWNAAAEMIFGFTATEAVGRNMMDLIGLPAYHEAKRKGLAEFARTGRGPAIGNTLELIALRKDGSEFPIEISLSGYEGADGFMAVALVRDISTRNRAKEERELALARQQNLNGLRQTLLGPGALDEKLKRITDGVVDIFDADFCRIWITHAGDRCESGCIHAGVTEGPHVCRRRDRCLWLMASSGRYTHIDGEVHRRVPFGCYKIGRVAAEQDRKFLTNEAATDPRVHNHEWVKELGLVSFAGYQLRPPGGETIGVLALFSKHVITPEEDGLLESLANTAAQVIQRARADEELKQAHAETKHLLESIPLLLIALDAGDRVTSWNSAAERAFGIVTMDAVGQLLADLEIEWDHGTVARAITECRANNRLTRVDELRFKPTVGTGGFLSIASNPLRTDRGECADVLLVVADITEQKILEGQLVQAQKLESIGQLAAGIAHEINTPIQYVGDNVRFLSGSMDDLLGLISSYRDLVTVVAKDADTEDPVSKAATLERDADLPYLEKELPKSIAQSLDGVARVSKIVRAMKDFSHPDGEGMEAVDLNKAIESTVTVARNEWKYVAEVVTEFDPALPLVPCLVGDFNQGILNIVINAAHAIADVVGDGAGGKGTITVSTRCDGEWAEVRIRDTGAGIPEEYHSKVFNPFFTTKEVGKGTGQGLSIAHAVITEKHGGTINFETEKDKGTTFVIRLPIENEAATVEETP